MVKKRVYDSTNTKSDKQEKSGRASPGFRIKLLVAVVGSTLTALIFAKGAPWGTVLLSSVLAALMGYELAAPTGWVRSRFVLALTVLCAAAVPWAMDFNIALPYMAAGIFAVLTLEFAAAALSAKGPSAPEILHSMTSILLFPSLIGLLPQVLQMENGRKLAVVPFVIAWCADGGAQIVGMLWGRHKLIERISPSKTVEGFFGGIGGAVLGMAVYAGVLALRGVAVRLWLCALLAVVGTLFAVLGDLALSMVKRSCGIKDFSRLLPQHGGVLDRFDSVVFVLPLCYLVFQFLPIV